MAQKHNIDYEEKPMTRDGRIQGPSRRYRRLRHPSFPAALWTEKNPLLQRGEIGIEIDTRNAKLGDGHTYWNDLPYAMIPSGNIRWGDLSGDIDNQTDLKEALDSKQDVIADLSTIRSDASAGKTAKDTIDGYGDIVTHNASEFAKPSDIPTKTSELENDNGFITSDYHDSTKQDVISDLDTIRSDASAGKTAKDTIDGYGDIVTHNANEFQTAGDYATKTELNQKQDVISDLDTIRSNAQAGKDIIPQVNTNTQRIEDLTVARFPNVVIVGTPHIEGGQVSNYSDVNYLQFPFVDISRGQPFDIYFSFTTAADVTTQQNILDAHFGIALAIQNGKGIMALSSNGTSWDIGTAVGTNTLLPNTTYYVKYSWTGTAYSAALSTNDTEYVPDMNLTSSLSPYKTTIFIGGSPNLFGPASAHPFKGTINFNKSKVVVNGITVWEGMADVGLASRANVSLNNLDEVGEARFTAKQDVLSAGHNIDITDNVISSECKVFNITEDMLTMTTDPTKGVAPYNTSYGYTNYTISEDSGVEWIEGALYSFVINTKAATSTYRNVRIRIGDTGAYIPAMNYSTSILTGSTYFVKNMTVVFVYKKTQQANGALHLLYDANTNTYVRQYVNADDVEYSLLARRTNTAVTTYKDDYANFVNNVTLNPSKGQISAAAINLNGSDLKTVLDGKQPTGDYALKREIPTNVSAFTNDAGYVTSAYHDSTKQDVATAVNYDNITNCITEIPQDIKLELSSDGTLTLKAGSKVYVPNGAGVFDLITTTQDCSLSGAIGANNTKVLIAYKNNSITTRSLSSSVSGSGATTSGGFAFDTTANKINFYSSSGALQSSDWSFPIAIVSTNSSGVASGIDQVFNGFGYIGSTYFVLPGVKGLVPNGRNADGSLNNTEINITDVKQHNPTNSDYNAIRLNNTQIGNGHLYYDNENNYNRLTDKNGSIRTYAVVGFYSAVNGKITSFTPKNAFHAVDYNDSEYIANQAMPSSRYVDLTFPAQSGGNVIAPADGYITIAKISGVANAYLSIDVVSNNERIINAFTETSTTTRSLALSVPVSKGNIVYIYYNATGTTTRFRFIYANGSK